MFHLKKKLFCKRNFMLLLQKCSFDVNLRSINESGLIDMPWVESMEFIARWINRWVCWFVLSWMFASLLGLMFCVFCGDGNNNNSNINKRYQQQKRIQTRIDMCGELKSLRLYCQITFTNTRSQGLIHASKCTHQSLHTIEWLTHRCMGLALKPFVS